MSVLFQPVTVGGVHLKNRFVRSAINDYPGRPDGAVSEQQLELYRELAAGGVGLIVTSHAYVQYSLGRASVNQNAIFDERSSGGWTRSR
jgi:2,4-dienoyl-CoA reductase-like NADH-dependent reductase (Old Yellow Enzyme family)